MAQQVSSNVFAAVGDGWGKSAMAHGYVARGWGLGWRCLVVQFVKGPDWHPGIEAYARELGVEWEVFGAGMTWGSSPRRDPVSRAVATWSLAADRLRSGEYRLIVLDEIGLALAYGWLEVDTVIAGVTERAAGTNVILTAPELPPALLALADVVTTFERTRGGGGTPLR